MEGHPVVPCHQEEIEAVVNKVAKSGCHLINHNWYRSRLQWSVQSEIISSKSSNSGCVVKRGGGWANIAQRENHRDQPYPPQHSLPACRSSVPLFSLEDILGNNKQALSCIWHLCSKNKLKPRLPLSARDVAIWSYCCFIFAFSKGR